MKSHIPTPDDARERLRTAADQVELRTLFQGVGIKSVLMAAGIGLVLGTSPAARRAATQGLRAVRQHMKALG